MTNLIVYGSLLNKDELKKHNIDLSNVKCVKVKGFRRIFNQEPSWRKADSIYRAVMNIQEDENSWLNALVITSLSKEYFNDLDEREKGYDKFIIPNGNVKDYNGVTVENCIVYKGKNEKHNDEIYPNKEYYKICLNGSKQYFYEFSEHYIKTTYKYDGKNFANLVKI